MKIFETPCFGCPFTKDSIVSPERVKSIVQECRADDVHFNCHKSTYGDTSVTSVVCGGYYQSVYLTTGAGQLVRIMERLELLKLVPVPPKANAEARRTMLPYRLQARK